MGIGKMRNGTDNWQNTALVTDPNAISILHLYFARIVLASDRRSDSKQANN